MSKVNGVSFSNVSFGAKPNNVNKIIREVSKVAEQNYDASKTAPKLRSKIFKFLNDHDGEIQNQAINAFFTTTLAPLMIWKNPFSKKDEKTKAYSAIRQPISAAIALTGGLGMTLAVNKYMENMYNGGYIQSIDGRMEPSKPYLKSEFAKELKEAKNNGNVDAVYEKYAKDAVESGVKGKELQKEAFENFSEMKKAERKAIFEKLITEKPENIKIDEGVISVNGKKLAENIPNLSTQKDLDGYIKNSNFHNKSFASYMSDTFGIKIKKDGQLSDKTKAKLNDIKMSDFLKKLGIIDESVIAEGAKVDEKSIEALAKTMTNGNKEKYISDLMNKSTADALKTVTEGLKKAKTSVLKDSANISDVSKNAVKNMISVVNKNFQSYKKYTGIAFNLPMTMITCTVLNWVYPRFIEKFIPSLIKKPVEAPVEGGNK